MKRQCDICGNVQDDYWMESYNCGSRLVWLCWDCWKNSQFEANHSDRFRQDKLYKILKSKQRNK